jgi:hypothetical protein
MKKPHLPKPSAQPNHGFRRGKENISENFKICNKFFLRISIQTFGAWIMPKIASLSKNNPPQMKVK